MGVFTRFKDIVGANINTLLEKAENPEKMIKLMMQEMEDTLIELKSACAEKLAAKAKAQRQLEDTQQRIDRWQQRAELAVEKGRDELAREALIEKRRCESDKDVLEGDLKQYDGLISECRKNILQLEEKLQTVKQKHKLLVQRGAQATEQKKAKDTIRSASDVRAYQRFSDLENRIERMEAEAEMADYGGNSTLEDEFSRMEASGVVEEELEQLKQSMKSRGGAKKE